MKTREAIISKEKSSEEKAVKSGLSRLIKNALPNLATSRVTNGLYDDYIFFYSTSDRGVHLNDTYTEMPLLNDNSSELSARCYEIFIMF